MRKSRIEPGTTLPLATAMESNGGGSSVIDSVLTGMTGWLSIEHEDIVLSRVEGMRRSIDFLQRVLINEPSDYALPNA